MESETPTETPTACDDFLMNRIRIHIEYYCGKMNKNTRLCLYHAIVQEIQTSERLIKSDKKSYKFTWRDGSVNIGEGDSPEDALTHLGFGAGSIPALDTVEEVA